MTEGRSPAAQIIEILDPLFDGRVTSDRDEAAELTTPYAAVLWPVNRSVAMIGDARVSHWRNLWQVDVWQRRSEEDRDLTPRVLDALDGRALEGGGRLRIQGGPRVPDSNFDLIHDAITGEITRQRRATS